MEQEIQQLMDRVQFLEKLLFAFVKTDNYYFGKHIVLADGVNVKASSGTGTKIGTGTGQKLSVYGVTPVIQAAAIATPNTQGATYNQTDVTTLKTAIDSIRTALTNFGITA